MSHHPPSRISLLLISACLILALLLFAARLAFAESSQRGHLIASLDGAISPLRLPRDHAAPARLTLSGALRTADRSPLPRVRSVELALAARGGLDTDGLPACSGDRLRASSSAGAIANCGPALVGRGELAVSAFLPTQRPFAYRATLLVFNARRHGRPGLWLHIYGRRPPSAFLLPVTIERRRGDFPTALHIAVPPDVGPWPHLARFRITLARRFAVRGHIHSYLHASCPLPPRFSAGIFPFARATYSWGAGETLTTTIVRGCRVTRSRPL